MRTAACSNALARTILASFLLCVSTSLASAGETITFFHADVAGSPLLATDVNGIQVWKETYRPYGNRLIDSAASDNNSVWFAGKPYDESTGLSYMGARYYDPTLGRFMAVDPVAVDLDNLHSVNRYAYANNNPYKFIDPNGESPTSIAMGYAHMQDLRRTNPTEAARVEKVGLAIVATGAAVGGGGYLAAAAFLNPAATAELTILGVELAASDALGPTSLVVAGGLVKLADDALVARGGANITAGSIVKGTSTHPSGVTGFSVESANGASLCDLCVNIVNNQVGVTTAGTIRAAGGDVVSTSGRSSNHATTTGLSPEKASELLSPSVPNPVRKDERNFR